MFMQFASGYAPILLQMYATSEFNFGTTENGYLMFGNSAIRGIFLLLMFPKIISVGRIWFNGTSASAETRYTESESHIPINPEDFEVVEGGEVPQEPVQAPDPDEEDSGTGFDLFFVRWSLVIDSMVTFFAGFSTNGWQVYLGKLAQSSHSIFRRVLTINSGLPLAICFGVRASSKGGHDGAMPTRTTTRRH